MALEVVGKGRGQKTAGGVLAGILHIALVEAALSGNFLDQFLVIAGNTKRLGGLFADGAAAAAKLTADGDNAVFHGDTPFRENGKSCGSFSGRGALRHFQLAALVNQKAQ